MKTGISGKMGQATGEEARNSNESMKAPILGRTMREKKAACEGVKPCTGKV